MCAAEHRAGREVHLYTRAPGELLTSALVALTNEASTAATVTVYPVVDGRLKTANAAAVTLGAGESTQVPVQVLIGITAGRHTVGIARVVKYAAAGEGTVRVTSTTAAVAQLP